jgi:uncharacterized protein YyaL (SSP411 family)
MISPDFKMYRTFKAGKKGEFAFLDDYAFTIQGFIKLYEVTFDETWLQTAKSLCDYVIMNFSDEEKVYFYYNSSLDPALIARKKETNAAASYPTFYSNWARVYIEFVRPLYEVAIVGPDFKKPQKELLSKFLPQAILLGGANEGSLELLKEKLREGDTYIYVCRNKVCKLPVKDAAKAIDLMK